jgi:hypothetical protein
LKTLDESRHGLPNMLLSGTSFNFAIWKSESNQTHVSGRTLSEPRLIQDFAKLAFPPKNVGYTSLFLIAESGNSPSRSKLIIQKLINGQKLSFNLVVQTAAFVMRSDGYRIVFEVIELATDRYC